MLQLLKIYNWKKERQQCRVYDDELDEIKVIFYYQYLWIINNGPIPKGHDIHHKDENPSNNDISNLICLTKIEHRRIHQLGKHYNLGNTSFKGKKHTEEAKKINSEKIKAKWQEAEYRAKLGKKSDETKRKMSEAQKGKKISDDIKNRLSDMNTKTIIIDKFTGLTYNSLSQCSKLLKKDKRFIKKHPERWEIKLR